MTWTYDTDTDIGKVRLELGDEIENTGVKPNGNNLTDEEIQVYLDREGSVMRAVAGICEALARHWARVVDITVGPRREALSKVAEMYSEWARELRRQYGGVADAFSVGVIRVDGYCDDEPSDATDETGSEYAAKFEYYRPKVAS